MKAILLVLMLLHTPLCFAQDPDPEVDPFSEEFLQPQAPEPAPDAASTDVEDPFAQPAAEPASDPSPAVPAPSPEAAPQPVVADNIPADKKLSSNEVLQILKSTSNKLSMAGAELITWSFQKYGQPTAVIVGGEGGAQFGVGYTKGKGQIQFKNQSAPEDIFWNAPALGFGAEVRGGEVAILVYGTTDMDQIVGKTYAGVKGAAHFIGGGAVQYLRNGSVSLAHVSVGLGLGATASIEALTITDKSCLAGKWLCH